MDSSECFFNGCKAAPGSALGEPVNLVDHVIPRSNMHAIKKKLSNSKLPLGFVSKSHKTRILICSSRKAKHYEDLFFLHVFLF